MFYLFNILIDNLKEFFSHQTVKEEFFGWIVILSHILKKRYIMNEEKKNLTESQQIGDNFQQTLTIAVKESNDLKEMLLAICYSVNSIQGVLKDGKIDFLDIGIIFALSAPVSEAIKGNENIINELKVMKPDTLRMYFDTVKQTLKIEGNEVLEIFIEHILIGTIAILAVASKKASAK